MGETERARDRVVDKQEGGVPCICCRHWPLASSDRLETFLNETGSAKEEKDRKKARVRFFCTPEDDVLELTIRTIDGGEGKLDWVEERAWARRVINGLAG
jgi:hypothetical protein